MREFLLRGKRLDNGEWVQGSLLSFGGGRKAILPTSSKVFMQQGTTTICCNECYDIDPSTTGQYTGLTDKNGKKIFEGDIISGCFRSNHSKQKFRVVFDDGMFLFDNTYVKVPKYEVYSMEIIGNVYENLELLEGGEDIATEEERI